MRFIRLFLLKSVFLLLLAATVAFAASDNNSAAVAARLAKKAEQARSSGQLVRAYLLYAEAASRDPKQPNYAVNRDALKPLAKLLATAQVEQSTTAVADEIKEAERTASSPSPFDPLSDLDTLGDQQTGGLAGLPHVLPASGTRSFDLRGDSKSALEQVAAAFGVRIVFDPQFEGRPIGRFVLDGADFKTAMLGITSVSETFAFAVDEHTIFVAQDTQAKRDEYEPVVIQTISLPDAVEPKDVVEAGNALRGAIGLRFVAWNSTAHQIVIRDRVSMVRAAQGILSAMILPRGQLQLKVQVMTVDASRSLHYGLALPTSFPLLTFLHVGNLQSSVPDISTITSGLFAFAEGSNFFGLALGNATAFAQYTSSKSSILYEATVAVGDGQTASLHVGDKYPIPQTLYTGQSQGNAPGVYNPIGQVTLEDLGLVLKVSPHIAGDGDISMDVEAEYRSLSGVTYDTVPAIAERTFKGSVRLREDQYAIIAGLTDDERTHGKSGIPGLAQLPWLDQLLAENNRTRSSSNTLLLIKPTITRLPMSAEISPQFLLGGSHGARLIL